MSNNPDEYIIEIFTESLPEDTDFVIIQEERNEIIYEQGEN